MLKNQKFSKCCIFFSRFFFKNVEFSFFLNFDFREKNVKKRFFFCFFCFRKNYANTFQATRLWLSRCGETAVHRSPGYLPAGQLDSVDVSVSEGGDTVFS